ncbi:MAG: restriction endonuclease subunit S [Verrucomicrobiota bacterium]|nr:restriction endonuclease subunit S [Verrucomicrobiota bacterium]MDQ2925313.1 restriction endonuclease subunit S [Acidobacteriota bacterium]
MQNTSSRQESGELPNGWRIARVGDMLKVRNGYAFKSSDYRTEGVALIRQSNLGDDLVDISEAKRVDPNFLKQLPDFIVRDGDLLIGMSGSLGKIARYQHAEPALQNQRTGLLLVKPEHEAKFAKLALKYVEPQILAEGKGIAVQNVSAKEIEDCTFPLPPLEEQRVIVAEIEKQFTRLEAGVAALRRVQANLKRYRVAVLKAACEGKLVPTEAELSGSQRSTKNSQPLYESGEQLLKRVLAERRQQWTGRGKYKEPAVPDTATLPPPPAGWTWASIDQLTSHITSGSRDWSQFYGKGNGTFILAQNVRPMRLDLSERQSVAAPQGDAETERTRVRAADLLVTIVGAKTGDICRVPNNLEDHFVCQSVALLRPVVSTSAKFAELYLASQENGQAQWKRYIYGQGRPHLSFEQLRMIAIALPPLAEQTRIVVEVERRLSVVEELESVVSNNLHRASGLRQSILRKAFVCELIRRPSNSDKKPVS